MTAWTVSERLPAPDSGRLKSASPTDDEVVTLTAGTSLVRVHHLGGPRPTQWNGFRRLGPTRFDHHPPPRRSHPTRRILYAAHGDEAFTAAIAECFQGESGRMGPIDAGRGAPAVTVFGLRDDVVLLDLDSGWVTRAGGNQAIRTGPRARAREWSRAIYRAYRHIAGVAYGSSVWGPGRCVALWERAEPALPDTPEATRLLSDPSMGPPLARAAVQLNTYVL